MRSSEMLGKGAKMGAPVMVSRTSPTSLPVELATAWNMTVIDYARRQGFGCTRRRSGLWQWGRMGREIRDWRVRLG